MLDIYDDKGAALKEMIPNQPEFLQKLAFLDQRQLDRLPDHAFAVVITDRGRSLRKMACVDQAHVAANVLYLDAYSALFPPAVVKTAARNLVLACEQFNLEVPEQLNKYAEEAKASICTDSGYFPVVEKKKPGVEKKASERVWNPYVDVSGYRVKADTGPTLVVKMGSADYEIDSIAGTLQAAHEFDNDHRFLPPPERRKIACQLHDRMKALGVVPEPAVVKFAAHRYADQEHIFGALSRRLEVLERAGAPELGILLTKLADQQGTMPPDEYAEGLREFDETTGLSEGWDDGVEDPYTSVLSEDGPAKDETVWIMGDKQVTPTDIQTLVGNRKTELVTMFGEEYVQSLLDDTESAFNSLSKDAQEHLIRMVHGGA